MSFIRRRPAHFLMLELSRVWGLEVLKLMKTLRREAESELQRAQLQTVGHEMKQLHALIEQKGRALGALQERAVAAGNTARTSQAEVGRLRRVLASLPQQRYIHLQATSSGDCCSHQLVHAKAQFFTKLWRLGSQLMCST